MTNPLGGPKRSCGTCTLCCKLLSVRFADEDPPKKPQAVWCEHCAIGQGCRIYADRPEMCRAFNCGWLDGVGTEEMRPDRSKVVLTAKMGQIEEGWTKKDQPVLIEHVDPRNPDAWRTGPMGRYLDSVAQRGGAVSVIAGTRRTLLTQDRRLVDKVAQAIKNEEVMR